MKLSSSFVCQECGYESAQWIGKCPECGTWNSLREFKVHPPTGGSKFKIGVNGLVSKSDMRPKPLKEIILGVKERIHTGFLEMDRVLGGGIVKGSVVLLAGDPGIGKSTLLLQAAMFLAGKKTTDQSVLYVSGEESEAQIKMRAGRLKADFKNENLLLFSATNTEEIVAAIEKYRPALVIVDSIQTMESGSIDSLSGSVGQVRYTAFSFIKIAKALNIPVVLVGHVTKEGMVAGPMILSHMVDTVLFFEGEKLTRTRILRGLKNRFGPIDEVGVFSMDESGIQEVKNPEQIFLTKNEKSVPGSVLSIIQEGTRNFLVELQALVVFSKLPMPRRVANGIDYRRLELLLAVLQKHCRLPLDSMDVFVNVAGGMKVADPAIDLSIGLAIFSSLKNIALNKTVGIAEVGLLGELRGVPLLEKRIKEAKSLGLSRIISNKTHKSLNEVVASLK